MLRKNPLFDRPDFITDPVFIVGNGTSRKNFDLERLKGKGTIIGCNAIYRNFTPDILTMVNYRMMREAREYCKDNFSVILWCNDQNPKTPAREWKIGGVNSSGCLAIKLVSLLIQPKYCYMIGMDGYKGNIYNGTKNYEVDRKRNLEKMALYNSMAVMESKKTIFINVNTRNTWKMLESDKYEFMTYKEFEETVMA